MIINKLTEIINTLNNKIFNKCFNLKKLTILIYL